MMGHSLFLAEIAVVINTSFVKEKPIRLLF